MFGMPAVMMGGGLPDWASENNARKGAKFAAAYTGIDFVVRAAEKHLDEDADTDGVADTLKETAKETPGELLGLELGNEAQDENGNDVKRYGLRLLGQKFGVTFKSDSASWQDWVSNIDGYAKFNMKKLGCACVAWFAKDKLPG